MYNKIFTKILDSSIWLEPTSTRIVWITLIAAMDQDGYAHFSAIENLAIRAHVSLDEAKEAVKILTSPDENSADPDHNGRRIERIPGGFLVLNAEKHRDLVSRVIQREQTRKRVAKHRENKKCNASVTDSNEKVTQSYTEAVSNTDNIYTQTFEEIWKLYPKRAGSNPKRSAFKTWKNHCRYEKNTAIREGVERYAAFCRATGKTGTEYVMQAKTFFGPDKHFLEPWTLPAPEDKKPWEMSDSEVMAECKELNIKTMGKNKKQLHTEMLGKRR